MSRTSENLFTEHLISPKKQIFLQNHAKNSKIGITKKLVKLVKSKN